MLTPTQEKWVDHLSDETKIIIIPFDPTSGEKFQKARSIIQEKLGAGTRVEHRGATALGISGQDEIDVYVSVPEDTFDRFLPLLTELFGAPRSHYPLERARFVTDVDGKHVDVFLMNDACDGWRESVLFENYLKTHPEALDAYRQLKESGDGVSVRAYYRRKIEFINSVLEKARTGE